MVAWETENGCALALSVPIAVSCSVVKILSAVGCKGCSSVCRTVAGLGVGVESRTATVLGMVFDTLKPLPEGHTLKASSQAGPVCVCAPVFFFWSN